MSNYVNLMDIVYPVGSVFISNSGVSPASSIGGTWTKLDSDTFICCGTPNTTGGANSIRLTINEMPSHNHKLAGFANGSVVVRKIILKSLLMVREIGIHRWIQWKTLAAISRLTTAQSIGLLTSISAQPSYMLGGVA